MAIEDYLHNEENDEDDIDLSIEIDITRGNKIRRITKITDETEDEDNIYIPDIIVPLYTLLAAHYAWLDDDITKATIYWNEYDDLKNRLIGNVSRPRNAVIIGGF